MSVRASLAQSHLLYIDPSLTSSETQRHVFAKHIHAYAKKMSLCHIGKGVLGRQNFSFLTFQKGLKAAYAIVLFAAYQCLECTHTLTLCTATPLSIVGWLAVVSDQSSTAVECPWSIRDSFIALEMNGRRPRYVPTRPFKGGSNTDMSSTPAKLYH